jgi:small-conductance mechanosensitive channel
LEKPVSQTYQRLADSSRSTEDYWELKFAMLKEVKEAFDSKGISIPYPHSVEIQKSA